MWQVLQQQDVLHYGKLEEFVSLVMETFPELLSESQRTELYLGLQQFGTKTDPALDVLLWEFLSRLDQLLPVADLKQTVSWLGAVPSVLEVCVQSVSYSDHLKTLLRHHRSHRQLSMNATLPSTKERKLSSMSRPPFPKVVDSTRLTNANSKSESVTDRMNCLCPSGEDIKAESVTDSSEYAEVEPRSRVNGCEDIEAADGKLGYLIIREQEDVLTIMKEEPAEAWESLSVKIEREDGVRDEEGLWKEEEQEGDKHREGYIANNVTQTDSLVNNDVKSEDGQWEGEAPSTMVSSCQIKEPRVQIHQQEIGNSSVPGSSSAPPNTVCRRAQGARSQWTLRELSPPSGNQSLRLKHQAVTWKRNTIGQLERPLELLPSSSENGICAEASVISLVSSPRNKNTGQAAEVSSQVFACFQCQFAATDQVNLHQHIKEVHTEELNRTVWSQEPPRSTHQPLPTPTQSYTGTPGAHACSQCGKSFRLLGHLKAHKQTHTGERPYHCSQCGKRFSDSSNLKRHQRTHTGERPYHCSQCGRTFTLLGNLKKHQQTHTGDRPYHCSQCGRSFSQLGNLKKHQQTHTGDRPHHCSQCGRSFSQLGNLKQHQQTHTGDRPYQCSQCGRSFSQLGNLKQHQQTHTGDRPHHCSQCGRSFSQLSKLKQHLQTHTGERPYHCSQCEKSYFLLRSLKKHLRTHTGERPYVCSQCGSSFTDLSTLKRHHRTHTGERPYHCSQCGKNFSRSHYLKQHRQTHTGERPYHCSQCEKSFTLLVYLKAHQRKHTG